MTTIEKTGVPSDQETPETPITPSQKAGGSLFEAISHRKIASLDGLRAVAVLLVIFHHLGIRYAPNGRGVMTFFVLSGFLITWLMLKESEKYGEISIKGFYVRRVLRIFPAFYVFWVIHLLLILVGRTSLTRSGVLDYASSFFYASNYWHAFSGSRFHHLRHTWALSIEEQFYLMWPLFFALFQHNLKRLTAILIGMIAFVDIYRMVLFFKFDVSDDWLTFTFDSRIDHLLVGCLLAVVLKRGVFKEFWEYVAGSLRLSVIAFMLSMISAYAFLAYGAPYKFAVGFVIDPLLTAILLTQVMTMPNSWMWGWLNWRVTRYIGQISYSMFLYHVIGNEVAKRLLGHRSMFLIAPLAVGLTIVMGTISYYAIELRFLRLKGRFAPQRAHRPMIPAAQASTAIPAIIR